MSTSTSKATKPSEQHLTNLLTNPKTFSISSYLNTALKSKPEEERKESIVAVDLNVNVNDDEEDEILQRRMAELALQLQVQTQSCHDEIGRIGAELRAILPRCAGDLGRLDVGLNGMKEDTHTLLEEHLKSSLGYVEKATESDEQLTSSRNANLDDNHTTNDSSNNNTTEQQESPSELDEPSSSSSNHENEENVPPSSTESQQQQTNNMTPLETLETLSTLHALQQNLTITKSILHSVSTYDKTISTIPSLLTSSQNLNHAVSALITLEKGAKALSSMPGQSERDEEIKTVRDKILTLLKPELLHALKKMESRLGPLQTCVSMYNSLDKMESLMEEYVKNRPGSLHRLWFEFGKVKSSGTTTTGSSSTREATKLQFYGEDGQQEDSPTGNDDDDDLFAEDDDELKTQKKNMESSSNTNTTRALFGEWLPTWYDAVLLLLSEEQRRALTVFGPELAPEIMARILNECFRPIISFFKARLVAIYPTSGKEGSSTLSSSGSFETICAVYEATLQFLSVAYETMIDFDHDTSSAPSPPTKSKNDESNSKNSSSPSRTKTPVELYHMIRSIFITIGSPFAPYQSNYSHLETIHSGMTVRVVSRDIHGAVMLNRSAGLPLLQSLQDSVEKLNGLAPFIFPLAQASMTRFESLNSGYSVCNALSTIDALIARHTGEISIAIHTLSTNILNDKDKIIDTFDEQQVQYALDVLKIAGIIRRDLTAFEEKARDRLRILAGRMGAAIDQECSVKDTISNSGNSWSLVPNSLSAVDIEAILAMPTCAEDGDMDGSSKSPSVLILQRFARPDKVGKNVVLFPDSVSATSRLVKSCQSFVFDICSALPMKHLEGLSLLPVWKQEESFWSSSTTDTYGTLPQAHITHVGEHMLALVQALEPFASDTDTLFLANLVMEDVEHVALKSWKGLLSAIDCRDSNEEFVKLLMKGRSGIKDFLIHQDSIQSFDDDEDAEDDDEVDSAKNAFCNQWLDAVCAAATGRLLEETMRIQHLSRKGCDHLAVDYNYIVNVFTALGVSGHPHPLLTHIVEMIKMDNDELQSRVATVNSDHQSLTSKVVCNVEKRIALVKGISVKF